jgi:hypothetical protein
MRMTVLALVACVCAAPALAAPICQNKLGDFVHCDAPSAMPVGWRVDDDAYTARVLARTPSPQARELFVLGGVLLCLFALIALLPRFDGARDEDWEP